MHWSSTIFGLFHNLNGFEVIFHGVTVNPICRQAWDFVCQSINIH